MISALLFLAGFALGVFVGVMWVASWIAGMGQPPTLKASDHYGNDPSLPVKSPNWQRGYTHENTKPSGSAPTERHHNGH